MTHPAGGAPFCPAAWLLLLSALPALVAASRAYPHGCLYRHPSYYTYDERDDISWAMPDELEGAEIASVAENDAEPFADFRRLPPKSSRLRRPYDRYRLTRRLGAGKFSDVFEAVDIQWEERIKAERKKRILRESGEESSGEGGGVMGGKCGETTEAEEEEPAPEKGEGKEEVDPESLVVLKCLKPVSERKIRRELLVLTHCRTLPNLARVIGIVLPDSMDGDGEEEEEEEPLPPKPPVHPRKRRRHHRLQREDIGSITDAASVEMVVHKTSTPAPTKSKDCKNNNHHGAQLPALVLEHAGRKSQWFCHGQQHLQPHVDISHLTEQEMKYYLCHLLVALDGLHSAGIMHRDVKPRNTLINRFLDSDGDEGKEISHFHWDRERQLQQSSPRPLPPPPLMLVDLGLADFYLPGKEYNVRVASRHYKSPELLIGFEYYDYAIDMWSVGCILAGLLFRREPFFRGKDNEDQLGKIVSVLGTRDFLPYCRKCNVRLSSKSRAAIGKYCSRASSSSSSSSEETPSLLNNDMSRRKPWLSFLSPTCPIPSPEALDLLDKLLVYDHEQRWTAREALGHSFFDDVRERVLREVQQRIALEGRWRTVSMQRR